MIVPVLLAGGSGNRLWPMSRELFPKQCLHLTDVEQTLIQKTLKRVEACGIDTRPVIVCNNDHRFLIAQQLSDINRSCDILLEPAARNTAPAIALAAAFVAEKYPGATILALPADHIIDDATAFSQAIEQGLNFAQKGKIVTFGVVPQYPETGYGYIEAEQFGVASNITAFHEKPDAATAEEYLQAGNYYWNSGMFLFAANTLLSEVEIYEPEVYQCIAQSLSEKYVDLDFVRAEEKSFKESPSVSIDVAIMERTKLGVVVPFSADWSDIGSWNSVLDAMPKDAAGNAVVGDVIVKNTENSLIYSTSRLVSTLGIHNLAVVDTPDALLVMDMNQGQGVKEIVAQIKQSGRSEHRRHSLLHRPWGSVEVMNLGEHYQVKHVRVKPSASISLQVHKHRAEHWVVVQGEADVSVGGKAQSLVKNESIYIEAGDVHALHNTGEEMLEIIEVQTGDYFGDDDVVRFTNNYIESIDQ
ncbi:mannose-1-phosphate guanylyltransferase/mannose-6-phosphate isomerase [Gilvimarinus agarilyticus]|uniref:mannose-1-phosphate guanylyltransferase/mannose-6-phosphate isomerase n=1 Tax=Gilvimarinus sp. 2_MG-2023 TaxID=3062666 RepID=UPI001C087C49|nr:mannose-1-phosphate guanylyltransferase/mannose-6-phosphate isomerase [Gilvimarinus sp. 2_MG-2023]MBU2887189.1 mannose-1-phosphate guanylyltransferase/mannose-6-phosphate isomerase [Gilvimarinus agarilyticus]MDO6571848.1 mannose-1-phosphate guanylyltransferase/mannose-6-phosphate isomerase [Gilvimarinus sp. 2_MG-2023]